MKTSQSWRKRSGRGSLPCLPGGSAKGHWCCIWHTVTLYGNVGTSKPTQSQEARLEWAVPHMSMAQSLGDLSGWLSLYLFPSSNPSVLCRTAKQSQKCDTFPIKKKNSANNLNQKRRTFVTHHIWKTCYILLNKMQMEIGSGPSQFSTPLVLLGHFI